MHTTYTVRENPLLLIHGAFIADALMPLVREPTVDEKYRLILYHRRGYGKSSHPKTLTSIAEQAADCTNLLDHLDIPHAHILGHSLGACIALQLALEDTDVVHTLALLEPALIVGSSGPASRESLEQGWQRFRNEDPEKLVDEFLEARYGKGYRTALDQVLPGAFEQAVADASTVFEQDAPALLAWRFGEAEASRIRQPVLVVYGSESVALWARFGETQQLILKWFPNIEGFLLLGAAHGLQLQNPPGMAEALTGFWSLHPIQW
ncbi:MAG: alpha/beta fold hydrolase [Methanoregulaceae archaeon]|nr:alpha/beta fold hydrolase [Methanoregulaceae archaeon]MCC7469493.1 alpha/beta fold hydrolase [Burkholderiaceae bacterium]NLH25224.1 alpha/beta hydrolase [Methanomicrobiales archaeon]HMZ31333.1 alpha/beta hydrolase [Methanoregulaceae archaeon]HPS22097.1 alpha/beta hydrolase [Methanoregulaceae archaeon]